MASFASLRMTLLLPLPEQFDVHEPPSPLEADETKLVRFARLGAARDRHLGPIAVEAHSTGAPAAGAAAITSAAGTERWATTFAGRMSAVSASQSSCARLK